MDRRPVGLILGTLLAFAAAHAAAMPTDTMRNVPAPGSGSGMAAGTIPQDIDTADYYALIAWAKKLGLSTQGTRQELIQRLYSYYGLTPPPTKPPSTTSRIITIDSATESSYFKIEQPNEQYLKLSGRVHLRMEDRKTGDEHEIEADEVVFNQTQNILTARGNIVYSIKHSNGQTELFHGQGLTFRLDTWDGFFISGTSSTPRTINGQSFDFSFSGDYISRSKDDTVVMDNGVVTSSSADPPNYSLRARRIWILQNGEWGVEDAFLDVGRVPVLYIPYFFKPGRQLVMHPALGYRSRSGSFLQTTVYLIGQKPDNTSPLSFLQVTNTGQPNTPKEVHGLFLKPVPADQNAGSATSGTGNTPAGEGSGNAATGAPATTAGAASTASSEGSGTASTAGSSSTPGSASDNWALKALADVYSRLGAFVGIQGTFPKLSKQVDLNFAAEIGVSRNLYELGSYASGGLYSPYFYNTDGTYRPQWNSSWMFGMELPFRYHFEFDAKVQSDPLTLSFQLPLYSDIYFPLDFSDRSEDINWAQLLGISGTQAQAISKVTSFAWQLSSTLTMPQAILPAFITSASISRLNASLSWQSQTIPTSSLTAPDISTSSQYLDENPDASFFYPDLITIPDFGLHLAGTLLSWPPKAASKAQGAKPGSAEVSTPPPVVAPWNMPGAGGGTATEPAAGSTTPGAGAQPGGAEPAGAQPGGAQGGGAGASAEDYGKTASAGEQFLPDARPDLPTTTPPQLFSGSLTYDIAPSLLLQGRTDSPDWPVPSAIDFSIRYWTLESRSTASLGYGLAFYDKLVSLQGNLALNAQYRLLYKPPGSLVSDWDSLNQQAYSFSGLGITDKNTITTLPLRGIPVLAASTLSYSITDLLFKRAYSGLDGAGNPVYTDSFVQWNDQYITAHSIDLVLQAYLLQANQTFHVAYALPPLTQQIATGIGLTTGPLSHSLTTSIDFPADIPKFEPFVLTETLSIGSVGKATDTAQYDPDTKLVTSNTATVSMGPFSAGADFRYTNGYSFAGFPTGWVPGTDDALRLTSISAGLNSHFAPDPFWKNRITFVADINSQLQMNTLRFTDSSFTFGLNLTLRIYNFVDLTFSSVSANSVPFLYIPAYAAELGRPVRNPIVDLLKSFNFFRRQDRVDSPFNLKQISVDLSHDLGDWTLDVKYSGSPQLGPAPGGVGQQYSWTSTFSLSVQWKPVPEIRRDIGVDQTGTLSLSGLSTNP